MGVLVRLVLGIFCDKTRHELVGATMGDIGQPRYAEGHDTQRMQAHIHNIIVAENSYSYCAALELEFCFLLQLVHGNA